MDGLKRLISLLVILAFFGMTPAPSGAQFPGMDMYGPHGMGGQMDPGMMGGMSPFMSPFGGMGGMGGMPFSMGTVEVYRPPAVEESGRDIVATMENVPQLSYFTGALKSTGYADKLKSTGTYVVFATQDQALQRDLSVTNIDSLLSHRDLVKGLVENSVVLEPVEPEQNSNNMTLTAVSGKIINARKEKTGMAANGADVLKVFKATNGLLIVTDAAVGV